MKKLLPVIILSVAALTVGCGAKKVDKDEVMPVAPAPVEEVPKKSKETHFMKYVDSSGDYEIWQDVRTGVEYLRFHSGAGESVTVMYYQNGEPFNDVQEADDP